MNFLKFAIPLMILVSLGPHYLFPDDGAEKLAILNEIALTDKETPNNCPTDLFEITWNDYELGIRDARLYGHVNIPEHVLARPCGSRGDVTQIVKDIVKEAVTGWWKNDQFVDLTDAEIHIISIAAKDKNTSNGNVEINRHGAIRFNRDKDGVVTFASDTLDFQSLPQ